MSLPDRAGTGNGHFLMNCHSIDQIESELARFTRWNRATVLPADDPSRRVMGFTAFYVERDLEHAIVLEIKVGAMAREVERLRKTDPERAEMWIQNRAKVAASYTARDAPTFRCDVCGSTSWKAGFDPASHDVDECNERLAVSVMDS